MGERCMVTAGSDRCERRAGHDGLHRTTFNEYVYMTWNGDEEWSHDYTPTRTPADPKGTP